MKDLLKRWIERFWMLLAWAMPRELVRWCHVRLVAHATMGAFSDTEVPSLTVAEAAKRWDDPSGGDTTSAMRNAVRAGLVLLLLLLIVGFSMKAIAQQSEFDRVHERGVAQERHIAQATSNSAPIANVPIVTGATIKVSAEDALKLRELQVKLLNNQNDMLITEMKAETLRKSNSAIMEQINKGIGALFDKAKVSQKDYTLDDTKWELVPKAKDK